MELFGRKVNRKSSLSADNLLLRGSSVQNIEWVYGIVVYSGHETKIMKNCLESKYKFSRLDKHTNNSILFILVFQMLLSFFIAAIGFIWMT
jgi:phospholipid-transporting ATPase